jgi:hypothetical protein
MTKELLQHVRFPLLWAYEAHLNTWLPRELDFSEAMLLANGQVPEHLSLNEGPTYDTALLQDTFAREKVVVLPNLLPSAYTRLLVDSYKRRPDLQMPTDETIDVNRHVRHNMEVMRVFHMAATPLIQAIVNEPIKPSYVLASDYKRGSRLGKHTDRAQCVYNISIMLSSEPAGLCDTWPFFIETPSGISRVKLKPGDGVLYRGSTDPHWRKAMPAALSSVLGMFCHYVPAAFTGSLD